MTADQPKVRKKDLTPRTRKIERRLRARLRRMIPDLDDAALFDAIRPQLAEAARDGKPDCLIERQLAAVAIRTLPGYIRAALAGQEAEPGEGGGQNRIGD